MKITMEQLMAEMKGVRSLEQYEKEVDAEREHIFNNLHAPTEMGE